MALKPQPRFSICYRHPEEPVTGFCASCLRERLAGLNSSDHREVCSSSSTEFRRCKSFSGNKCEKFSGLSEPRRRSCDVRVRNSLWTLFHIDDEKSRFGSEVEVESKTLWFREEEERESDKEIRVCDKANVFEERIEEFGEAKTMKEHIDLEYEKNRSSGRDLKDIASGLWLAASIFSKKLKKWRRKQKSTKLSSEIGKGETLDVEVKRKMDRQIRETQSDVGDYGMGRRSCDTDPRHSVDGGRISIDGSRYLFEEPRASWDSYLLGRNYARNPSMFSVVEDSPVRVETSVETSNSAIENGMPRGGLAQKRETCSETQLVQKQRISLIRSNSNQKMSLTDSISNAKVSPETVEYLHGAKLLITERDLRDYNFGFESPSGGGQLNGVEKIQGRHKGWNIWNLMNWRNDKKYEDVEKYFGKSCQSVSREVNEEGKGVSRKLVRSNSSGSSRSSEKVVASYGSRRSNPKPSGYESKRREEYVLERSRSAIYSPNNLDNGLLRFYLTPLRSSRKTRKSRLKNSNSAARSMFRL
ncbi:Protein OCTOPUS-like [Dillenia turbinata]|uniref:Protein OCTOPUS-like n=1 Tax=Dillenia turbinata TaxID=194707 RepID=A0AAN8VQ10_9MAGN